MNRRISRLAWLYCLRQWGWAERTRGRSCALWCLLLQTGGLGMCILFSPLFLSFFLSPPSKEIKSAPWQERVKSPADLPSAWNLQTLPCPSLLLSWGNTLPCCSLRLWRLASLPGPPALMWGAGCPRAGCCCPGLGFTLQNARRDVLSRTIHFEGPSHPQRFLRLFRGGGSPPWCWPQVAAPAA